MNDKNRRPDEPEEPAAGGKIDFEEIRKVIALLEEKNLSVFELEVEGFKIKITRSLPAAPPAPHSGPQPAPPGPSPARDASLPDQPPAKEADATLQMITSPMVGTFY
ncbi:MAG: hypothetical protein ACXVI6_04120, partial [Candidatus Aminicenantales bacterium]